MTPRLAVFDMDGTILDTLMDLTVAVNRGLLLAHLPQRKKEEVRQFLGNGFDALIARAVPEGTDEATAARVKKEFLAYYTAHATDYTRPYEGIVPLLHRLRAAGVKTAVVSNKGDAAVQELCRTYFAGCFDLAVGERAGVRRKPAPDMVNAALDELHIPREAAIFIGDSEVDFATATNAGLPAVLVTWGFRDAALLRTLGARAVVDTMEEIETLLLS